MQFKCECCERMYDHEDLEIVEDFVFVCQFCIEAAELGDCCGDCCGDWCGECEDCVCLNG